MPLPNYNEVYEALRTTPAGMEMWDDAMQRVMSARFYKLEAYPNNKTLATVYFTFSHAQCDDGEKMKPLHRKMDALGKPGSYTLSFRSDGFHDVYLVDREMAKRVIELHLGKEVKKNGCRTQIVHNGSGRSQGFMAWANSRLTRLLRLELTARLQRKRELEEQEVQALAEWEKCVWNMAKSDVMKRLKRLEDVPTDLLRECFDEYIINSVQGS